MTDQIPVKAIKTGGVATALGEFSSGDKIASEYLTVDYTQAGTGAVARPVADKAKELPSPEDFGAAGDGSTDDTTALSDAIAASDDLRLVGDYLVTALSNEYGVPLRGQGRILTAVTGGLRQINSDADDYQHMFGQEYLYAFHTKLMAGASASMIFSGDSTTYGGTGQATTPWLIHELVLRMGTQRGHKLTATNAGHPNKTTAQWVSTYLTGDLSSAPDLYVVRWGINDPNYGMSVSDFNTALRAGLAQCRSSYGVDDMSILLMVPNNINDTPDGRDQKWVEAIRPIVRQAARDYMCACIDTYAIWHDVNNGTGMWTDNLFGDGRSLHPMNVLNGSITSFMSNFLFPRAFDAPVSGTYTPSLTLSTNCAAASVPEAWQWGRMGNTVTVSGAVSVTPTSGSGLTLVLASLPIPSSFTSSNQCVGAANVAYAPYAPGIIISKNGTGNAQMGLFAQSTSAVSMFFTLTYRVK